MKEVLRTSEMWWSYGRWSGSPIKKTKDCGNCDYFKKVIDDEKGSSLQEEACLWGVAWKRLETVDNPRKCGKRNEPARINLKLIQ